MFGASGAHLGELGCHLQPHLSHDVAGNGTKPSGERITR